MAGEAAAIWPPGAAEPRERLRILYLTPFDVSRAFTGTATRSLQFLDWLAERHDTHLVYMASAPGELGAAVAPRLPGGLGRATPTPYSAQAYFLFDRGFLRVADQQARQGRFDLVVADCGRAGLYGLLLARRHGLPLVYMSHNVEHRLNLSLARGDWRRAALAAYLYAVERAAAYRAAFVTCITPQDAAVFAGWIGADRVAVLPGGFDAGRFNPFGARSDEPPRLLFVGNMTYPPNLEAARFILTKVMAPVLAQFPQARFQFVGIHPPGLERTDPRAEFTGYLDDVAPHTRAARLVLTPVFRGGGMRIKTIEALACGKVVVAAGVGAAGVDPACASRLRLVSAAAFADAVIHELRHGVADDGRDFPRLAAAYSTDAVMASFDALLRRAAGREAAG